MMQSRKKNRPRKKNNMPRELVTLECSEARKEGKSPSRYLTTRNKKLQTEKVEKMKYNPALRRHTLHKEVK
jgi:large subunit ribosomal protein L33